MNKSDIKNSIHQGSVVNISKEDYLSGGRNLLQDIAGEYIDAQDAVRGQIALMEVKRLDKAHGFRFMKGSI